MQLLFDLFNRIYNGRKSLLIFIFFASILASFIFLSLFKNIGPVQHGIPGDDYLKEYEPVANNILQGRGPTLRGVLPSHFPPGYPIILSGIFVLSQFTGIEKLDLIVVFNIILMAISVCLFFLIVKEFFNKRIALISSFLWVSYPFNLWFVKNPHTEVPFIFLFFLGIYFYILTLKRRNLKLAFWGGFFLGLASFVRLIGLFLPLFLALLAIFLLRSNDLKRKVLVPAILLIGSFVVVLPWAAYSISETGIFTPFSATRSEGIGIVFGITVLIAPMEDETDRAVLPEDVINLIERLKTENPENLSGLFQFFGQELINRPTPILKLIWLKLARVWYATSQQWWETRILLVQLFYLIPGFLGLIYIIRNYKDKTRDIIFLLSVIFYFWAMAFFNVSILRYMVPVMGIVIIFSAITVNIVIDGLVKKFKLYSPCQS